LKQTFDSEPGLFISPISTIKEKACATIQIKLQQESFNGKIDPDAGSGSSMQILIAYHHVCVPRP
jgi:hypothetical protein